MTTFAAAMKRREPPLLRVVRRTMITAACVYFVSATWGMYRRIRQILRIELHADSPVLMPGSTVGYDVVTSGEVQNLIRLELVQGSRHEVLLEQRASVNDVIDLDPRLFRYLPTVVMTSALLCRLDPGPATLRLTAFGSHKLMHTPAPRVRELEVRLQPFRSCSDGSRAACDSAAPCAGTGTRRQPNSHGGA